MAPNGDSAAAPRPTHNTLTLSIPQHRPPFHPQPPPLQPRQLHRVPRSASLTLELNALARSPGVRPSWQAFVLPDSPTPLPRRRASLATPQLDRVFQLRDPLIRYPLASYSSNFTNRRASMPASAENNNWDAERLSDNLTHRHSHIPPVPPVPSRYGQTNLARPTQLGRPTAAALPPVPTPYGRRPLVQSPTHYYQYANFDGEFDSPTSGVYNRRSIIEPNVAAPITHRRVAPPAGFVVPDVENHRGGPSMVPGVHPAETRRALPAGMDALSVGVRRMALPASYGGGVDDPPVRLRPNPPTHYNRANFGIPSNFAYPDESTQAGPGTGYIPYASSPEAHLSGWNPAPVEGRAPPAPFGGRVPPASYNASAVPSAGSNAGPIRRRPVPPGFTAGRPVRRPAALSAGLNEDYTTSATDTNDEDTGDMYSATPVANRHATPPTSFSDEHTTSAAETNDDDDDDDDYEDSDSDGYYQWPAVTRRRSSAGRGRSLLYQSTKGRKPTPTRVPPPPPTSSQPGVVTTPIQGLRSTDRPVMSKSGPHLESFAPSPTPGAYDFNAPSATLGNPAQYNTGISSAYDFNAPSATLSNPIQFNYGINVGHNNSRSDYTSEERPKTPVGRAEDSKSNEKTLKAKKSFSFFTKKAPVAPTSPVFFGPPEKPLRHQYSIFNLKKSAAKKDEDALAGEREKGVYGSDDPSSRRGPRKSKSMWSLRSKTETPPTLPPLLIGSPMNIVHTAGTGSALEDVMNRQAELYNDISGPHQDRSATSTQFSNENAPPVVRSTPAVHFAESTTSRLPRAPTTDHIGGRGTSSSRVPERSIPKSSTSAKLDGRASKSNMSKSSTSSEVGKNRWGFGPYKGSSSKLTGSKSKMSIGSPMGVVHTAGSGTAFENVTSVRYSSTFAGAAPVLGGLAVPNAPRAVDLPGLRNNTVLPNERSASTMQPQLGPERSPTPAPRPSSRLRNPFKRSTPSTMTIGSPFNATHEAGYGAQFAEATGQPTPARAGNRFQSMQDIGGRNTPFTPRNIRPVRRPSVVHEDAQPRNASNPARGPSSTDEDNQGRNFSEPLVPSKNKNKTPQKVMPPQALRLLGTVSPSRAYQKPSGLPLSKSKALSGKLSSLSSSFSRSVINLGSRNQSTASLLADSISLRAEPTTSISTATATAEPAAFSSHPLSPLLAVSADNVTMVYSPPLDNNWSGMFSSLEDNFLQDILDGTLRDPSRMQRYQNRSWALKKKKGKTDEDAGTIGIDNLLIDEESRYQRIFTVMESRAVGDAVKESLWTFQEQFALAYRMPSLVPASRWNTSFFSRINRVVGWKER